MFIEIHNISFSKYHRISLLDIQADKLANLVECQECLRKSGSCPKDTATFELVPNGNLPQPLTGFIGTISLTLIML